MGKIRTIGTIEDRHGKLQRSQYRTRAVSDSSAVHCTLAEETDVQRPDFVIGLLTSSRASCARLRASRHGPWTGHVPLRYCKARVAATIAGPYPRQLPRLSPNRRLKGHMPLTFAPDRDMRLSP